MLKKRLLTALWSIPLLIIIVWFGTPWFTILVVIWGLLAAFEFYRIIAISKVPPLTYLGLAWVLLFIISPHFSYDFLTPLLLTSAMVLSSAEGSSFYQLGMDYSWDSLYRLATKLSCSAELRRWQELGIFCPIYYLRF